MKYEKPELIYVVRLNGLFRDISVTNRDYLSDILGSHREHGYMGNYRFLDFKGLVDRYILKDPMITGAEFPEGLEQTIKNEIDRREKKW